MDVHSKIYIAGHDGMVGSAIMRNLQQKGYGNFITLGYPDLDLIRQDQVEVFFESEQPDIVIDAAAKVGGILANNTYRGQFIYENLMIQNNLIHAAHEYGVKKLLFLGSSCIYPKLAPQPLKEEYLLTGSLELTNEPYAIAKIAGIKMCENYFRQYNDNFISVMPTNLYGLNDNFNIQNAHVIPAMINKFHNAKNNNIDCVELWGSGTPLREFMFVEDMADACVFILQKLNAKDLYNDLKISHINIGIGTETSIIELAKTIMKVVGFNGKIIFDKSKPDGAMRKIMDSSRLTNLGWKPKFKLKNGLQKTYDWYINNIGHIRNQ